MEPTNLVVPTSGEELAEVMQEAAAKGRSLTLEGLGSKRAWGGAIEASDITVSTRALTKVLQYEPRDLTVSVEAGMPFREFEALLAGHNQMVPLDPPLFAESTVGGVVAANVSGSRRRFFGSARDMVIGMTLATMEGRLVKTGGMVVKNVAGLDVQKLMIGSYGTLAAIASVNFKVASRPAATRTFVQSFASAEAAAEARTKVLSGVLQPLAMDMVNPAAAARCGLDGFCLLIRAGGSERLLMRYGSELAGSAVHEGDAEAALWAAVHEFTPRFLSEHPGGAMVRTGHAMSDLRAVLEFSTEPMVCRAGNGVALIHCQETAAAVALANRLVTKGWAAVVDVSGAVDKGGLGLWPAPGDDLEAMQRMKTMFDPKKLLNRGRLHGRI